MTIRERIKYIEDCYDAHETPLVTYANACEVIGYGWAGDTIALMVKNADWDGRISPRNAEWAKDRLGHRSYTAKDVYDAYTTIHKAHLDQIADIARKLNY